MGVVSLGGGVTLIAPVSGLQSESVPKLPTMPSCLLRASTIEGAGEVSSLKLM